MKRYRVRCGLKAAVWGGVGAVALLGYWWLVGQPAGAVGAAVLMLSSIAVAFSIRPPVTVELTDTCVHRLSLGARLCLPLSHLTDVDLLPANDDGVPRLSIFAPEDGFVVPLDARTHALLTDLVARVGNRPRVVSAAARAAAGPGTEGSLGAAGAAPRAVVAHSRRGLRPWLSAANLVTALSACGVLLVRATDPHPEVTIGRGDGKLTFLVAGWALIAAADLVLVSGLPERIAGSLPIPVDLRFGDHQVLVLPGTRDPALVAGIMAEWSDRRRADPRAAIDALRDPTRTQVVVVGADEESARRIVARLREVHVRAEVVPGGSG